MIVQAALPLVAEHGAAVTTQQIARAAGIGEATIFRAFTDKDTLLRACIAEAVRPDHLVRELASIPTDQPLQPRLLDAAEALAAHLHRMGAVIGALAAGGLAVRSPGSERPTPDPSRAESFAATTAALVDLLEPDADRFRLPMEVVATTFAFFVMSFGRLPELPDQPTIDTEGMVDLFLNGALAH